MPKDSNRSAPKSATQQPVVTAEAVHETLMSMHARRDYNGMTALFKGTVDGADIMRLVHGTLVLVGDSEVGIEIVSAAEAGLRRLDQVIQDDSEGASS